VQGRVSSKNVVPIFRRVAKMGSGELSPSSIPQLLERQFECMRDALWSRSPEALMMSMCELEFFSMLFSTIVRSTHTVTRNRRRPGALVIAGRA